MSYDEQRLRPKQAAAFLEVSLSTLANWRKPGKNGPPSHRCGERIIYYVRSELVGWLAACDLAARPPQSPEVGPYESEDGPHESE